MYIYICDGARTIYSYPVEHGPSDRSMFGKTSPRKLLGKQPPPRYIQSRLLGGPPRSNKPPAIGWSAAVCRRHLRMRVFGPNRDRSHSRQSVLQASVEADSSQNLYGSARSPRWSSCSWLQFAGACLRKLISKDF